MEMRGAEDEKQKRVFMVSDFSVQQMRLMEEAIVRLGGRMTKEPTSFDPLATHLITGSVARTEKVVISAASGLWILHPSFLTESLSRGKWEEEENFEWGNKENGFLKFEEELSEEGGEENTEVKLAAAARNWRRSRQSYFWSGAFSDIKAMLVMPEQRKIQFEKLITAGGGQVIQAKAAIHLLHFDEDSDDTNAPEVTHIFTESPRTLKEEVDLPREVETSTPVEGRSVRSRPRVSYAEVPDTNAFDMSTGDEESPFERRLFKKQPPEVSKKRFEVDLRERLDECAAGSRSPRRFILGSSLRRRELGSSSSSSGASSRVKVTTGKQNLSQEIVDLSQADTTQDEDEEDLDLESPMRPSFPLPPKSPGKYQSSVTPGRGIKLMINRCVVGCCRSNIYISHVTHVFTQDQEARAT